MNLKEAFHYQSVLDGWMSRASAIVSSRANAYNITKNHLYSKADETREDVSEKEERLYEINNDSVIEFMKALVAEKQRVSEAITKEEMKLGFDINAEIAANKFRNSMIKSIRNMLTYKPKKNVDRGIAYRFNNDGNQTSYTYDIENVYEEAFDRGLAKELVKNLESERNETSVKIDAALINAVIDFCPMFDEEEGVEDIVSESFCNTKKEL